MNNIKIIPVGEGVTVHYLDSEQPCPTNDATDYYDAIEAIQQLNAKIAELEHNREELIIKCIKMIRELPANEYTIRINRLWNQTKNRHRHN